MVVMIEKRRIELRIRGAHAPPSAEELALATLKACCSDKARKSRHIGDETMQSAKGISKSQCMAEVVVTKYCPHG